MICRLFIFRHAETFDNSRGIFSGWRDSRLTLKGLEQAQKTADQLKRYRVDYAFTSHLKRARETLQIVLQDHPPIPVFIDDRLIERCYGLLQGKNKAKLEYENPDLYAQIHRGYDFIPPEGESLRMVEKRVNSFLEQLKKWFEKNPCNVAISCHSNSIRPIIRGFEHLNVEQMLRLDVPQDSAVVYELNHDKLNVKNSGEVSKPSWSGTVISRRTKLAIDPLNSLSVYY